MIHTQTKDRFMNNPSYRNAWIKIWMSGILSSILIFSFSSLSLAQNLELDAYVNRTTVGVNEQFELSVELSGSDANDAPQPAVPDLGDFATYLGSGSSTNMQIVNGQMSVSKIYTHHFMAVRDGKFQIPPIRLQFKGKEYTTDAIDIEVVKGQTRTTPPPTSGRRTPGESSADLSELLFLKATVNKRQVFQNEPVIVSYKIYTAVSVSNYGISQLPNMVGFWSEEFELPQRPRLYAETVNGRQYKVAEIKKMALFPQGPGNKTIEPMTIECEVQIPRQRRSRDPFNSFFDDPFDSFFNRTVRQTVTSNAISIEVMPLPAVGKPGNFSGAVGNFSLGASVDKNAVKTNEAVTLTVKISGSGNIKIVPQPEINFPVDFEVYDPKIQENINRKGGQISGAKVFEYVMVPRYAGKQVIKPVTLSYFDLSTKTYRTLRTEPLEISVAKGNDEFVSIGAAGSKEDVKLIGQDIRYIQMRMPEFERIDTVFYKKTIFFVLLGFPLVVLAGALGYRRHQEKLSTNVAYARSRKANQMATRRLKKAGQEMKAGNPKAFYAEVSSALMGFIGDKLNVASAGLVTDEVNSMLHQRGIDEETVTNYIACLQTCDYKRFAPSDANNGEMKEFFARAKQAIISLDKEI